MAKARTGARLGLVRAFRLLFLFVPCCSCYLQTKCVQGLWLGLGLGLGLGARARARASAVSKAGQELGLGLALKQLGHAKLGAAPGVHSWEGEGAP